MYLKSVYHKNSSSEDCLQSQCKAVHFREKENKIQGIVKRR